MRTSVAVIRLALVSAALGGFVLAGCGDDETEGGNTTATGGTTATGTGTATGGGSPSGSATGTPSGSVQLPTCAESCTAVIAANCANGPQDMQGCQNGCAASEVYCLSEITAAAQCAGPSPTYTCTANDVPAVAGCESQYQAVVACLGAVVVDCNAECPDVVAAGCTNGPPDLQGCAAGCADATTNCPVEYAAVDTCTGANPTYECNSNQVPRPVGCGTEHDALMTCLNN